MTACCCRLTQPAKRKTTNTNGAGSESMAQACPRGGPSARRAEIRDRRYPVGPSSRTQASCDSRNAPIVEQSGLGGVFAQDGPDLERKLTEFQAYYNAARSHASLEGHTPLAFASGHTAVPADLNHVRWVSYCRGLVQLPVAA